MLLDQLLHVAHDLGVSPTRRALHVRVGTTAFFIVDGCGLGVQDKRDGEEALG